MNRRWRNKIARPRAWIERVRALDPRRQRAVEHELREQLATQSRTLEDTRRDLIEAARAKDELVAVLAHELRNPLSPMQVALQVLRLRGQHSHEQDVLERQLSHLTRLVEDLFDVSRLRRGRIDLHRRDTEVASVIAAALEISAPQLEHRGHQIEIAVPPRGLRVSVDLERMAQVVSNLVINAAKYSADGSRITVRADRVHADGAPDRVRIRVDDEGVGIAPEMIERVFDLFVQNPATLGRSRGGLGLGLAIVRSLVELHGGRVFARSPGPGKGSSFVVELPARPDLGEALASAPTPPPA